MFVTLVGMAKRKREAHREYNKNREKDVEKQKQSVTQRLEGGHQK